MFTKSLNIIALLLNLFMLFPSTFVQAQGQGHLPTKLKCFDEKHPPPSIAGGLDLIVTESATTIVNPHPEKKEWNDPLTEYDFEWQASLPGEIAEVNPEIRSWISVSWKGWWEVGCFVESFDEKEVLITVQYLGFSSGAWFLQEQSGRAILKMGKELLKHEQGHFDIVELGRRRWQNWAEHAHRKLIKMADQKQFKPSIVKFAPNDQASISKKAREMIEELANQKDLRNVLHELARYKWIDTGWTEGVTELYEYQTNYGAIVKEQKRWEKWIWEMFAQDSVLIENK